MATGQIQADVVIVGAGILGLSLALHLCSAGVNVVVIGAQTPGFGASGRNTEFVVPSLTNALGPSQLNAMLGSSAGEKLTRFVGESGNTVFKTSRAYEIECSAEQTGWVQAAYNDQQVRTLEDRVKQLRRTRQKVRLLDQQEIQRRTGTSIYAGAAIHDTGGQLNPLAYVRGMSNFAVKAGLRLFGNSPAFKLQRSETSWQINTPESEISAERVFLTTNALGKPGACSTQKSVSYPTLSSGDTAAEQGGAFANPAGKEPSGRFASQYFCLSLDAGQPTGYGRDRYSQQSQCRCKNGAALYSEAAPLLARSAGTDTRVCLAWNHRGNI